MYRWMRAKYVGEIFCKYPGIYSRGVTWLREKLCSRPRVRISLPSLECVARKPKDTPTWKGLVKNRPRLCFVVYLKYTVL